MKDEDGLLYALGVIILDIVIIVLTNNLWLGWIGVGLLTYLFIKDDGD